MKGFVYFMRKKDRTKGRKERIKQERERKKERTN